MVTYLESTSLGFDIPCACRCIKLCNDRIYLSTTRRREDGFSNLICYRQLNSAEKTYTTTEREGLGMVYAVKKFWHYLLANKFTFFVDHQSLLYLVNKPCSTRRIARWFLFLLEFDFTVVVKKGSTHIRADHLSRMIHGEPPLGVAS